MSTSNTPTRLEPEAFCWALTVESIQVVLVLEAGYLVDAPLTALR